MSKFCDNILTSLHPVIITLIIVIITITMDPEPSNKMQVENCCQCHGIGKIHPHEMLFTENESIILLNEFNIYSVFRNETIIFIILD